MDPPKGQRYKPGESPQRAPASEVARDSRTKTPQKTEERCPSLPPKHADAQGDGVCRVGAVDTACANFEEVEWLQGRLSPINLEGWILSDKFRRIDCFR